MFDFKALYLAQMPIWISSQGKTTTTTTNIAIALTDANHRLTWIIVRVHSSVGKESACNAGDQLDSWVGKIHWRRDRLPAPGFLGFLCDSAGKESTCNTGDLDSIPGLGRCPEEGKGYPFKYSGLVNSTDCIIHGVTKSWTGLNNCHFHFLQTSDVQSTRSWTLLAELKHLCTVVVC